MSFNESIYNSLNPSAAVLFGLVLPLAVVLDAVDFEAVDFEAVVLEAVVLEAVDFVFDPVLFAVDFAGAFITNDLGVYFINGFLYNKLVTTNLNNG